MSYFNVVKTIILFCVITLLSFSSLVFLYEKRTKIDTELAALFPLYYDDTTDIYDDTADIAWAKRILKGGYLLHFRHAERDKWIDVQMYDALESDVHNNGVDETRYAEKDYFSDAVCLNQRGKVQAKAMGEHIKNISLPIGYVISSPICRSRQTAELAFNGYQKLNRMLVHKGPYSENENDRIEALKKLYLQLPISDGTNTVISSHDSVVNKKMFVNSGSLKPLGVEEGGFYVISRANGELKLEHEFHNFKLFTKAFYER